VKRILLGLAAATFLWSLALGLGTRSAFSPYAPEELDAAAQEFERVLLREGPDAPQALESLRQVRVERRRRWAWKAWAVVGTGLLVAALRVRRRDPEAEARAEEARLLVHLGQAVGAGSGNPVPDGPMQRRKAAELLGVMPTAPAVVVQAAFEVLLKERPPEAHEALKGARDLLLGGASAPAAGLDRLNPPGNG